MEILILGPDCDKCRHTKKLVEDVLKEFHLSADVQTITDIREILEYAVMMTPAVIIDDKEMILGGVPTKEQVRHWFKGMESGQ